MTYALATLRTDNGPTPAVRIGSHYYRLVQVAPGLELDAASTLGDVFARWEEAEPLIEAGVAKLAAGHGPAPMADEATASFLPPIQRPSKILCVGANYHDHLKADFDINDFDKSKQDVLYFMKHPGALVGSGQEVRYPSQSTKLDWELELVVVFGKRCRRVTVEEALDHVAGYTIGIDLSARDWQFNPRHTKQFDLLTGKSFDDSAPCGPTIVPARFVDLDDTPLKLWVNDALKQDSNTRFMIWSVAELVADLSQHITMEPGDLLYTGSPAGVGIATGTFLKVGDHVKAEIGAMGRLEIEIAEDPDRSRIPGA
ncbi:fumarylacetoacetate hydrolase family protein [Sphingomonas mali]|uniref:fumarylacetoacetate hydrolase family protein n=1 Tax=Sphingomonas mali TaxID=40682 RepID=UPI0008344049|nr:fumarylacetoacetate hydrolase family protein [Sphingomonas mali]